MATKTYEFAILVEDHRLSDCFDIQVKLFETKSGLTRTTRKVHSIRYVFDIFRDVVTPDDLFRFGSMLQDFEHGRATLEGGTIEGFCAYAVYLTSVAGPLMGAEAWVGNFRVLSVAFSRDDVGVTIPVMGQEKRTHYIVHSRGAPVDSVIWEEDALPETGA